MSRGGATYRAISDFFAEEEDELDVRVDDIVKIIARPNDEWWEGEIAGKRGVFPSNFVVEEGPPGAAKPAPAANPKPGGLGGVGAKPAAMGGFPMGGAAKKPAAATGGIGGGPKPAPWDKPGANFGAASSAPKTTVKAQPVQPKPSAAGIGVDFSAAPRSTPAAASPGGFGGPPMGGKPGGGGSKKGVAMYDYTARNDEEMSFREGDVMTIVNTDDPDWMEVELYGQTGFVPANYVEIQAGGGGGRPSSEPPGRGGKGGFGGFGGGGGGGGDDGGFGGAGGGAAAPRDDDLFGPDSSFDPNDKGAKYPPANSGTTMYGYMIKRKASDKKWEERWIVLRANGELMWFKKRKDKKPAGTMMLRGARVDLRSPPDMPTAFLVGGGGQDYYFGAASPNTLREWSDAISQCT